MTDPSMRAFKRNVALQLNDTCGADQARKGQRARVHTGARAHRLGRASAQPGGRRPGKGRMGCTSTATMTAPGRPVSLRAIT